MTFHKIITNNAKRILDRCSTNMRGGPGCEQIYESIRVQMIEFALLDPSLCMQERSLERSVKDTIRFIEDFIADSNNNDILLGCNKISSDEHSTMRSYVTLLTKSQLSAIYLTASSDNTITINIVSIDKPELSEILNIVHNNSVSKNADERKYIHALLPTDEGLTIKKMGSLPEFTFNLSNYTAMVQTKFTHLQSDLTKEDPCGKISIFYGPPGTGKSYLVRQLVKSTPNAKFIYISSSMVANLTDPDFLQSLITFNNRNNNTYAIPYSTKQNDDNAQPSILVIEDADSALVPRQSDNISAISNLLNSCDGLLGDVLNVRVIATTNAQKLDIDKAILRPGRLCTLINVDTLTKVEAVSIFERLKTATAHADLALPEQTKYTLAEIYAYVRSVS